MSGGPSSVPSLDSPSAPSEHFFIAHRSSQTGDTLHVAGTLALYSNVDVLVVHVGPVGTTEGLLNFYRQATDPKYPGAAISPDSAAINERVKVVYASKEAVAETLYTTLSKITASDASVQTVFSEILSHGISRGILSSETPKVGATPAALKEIQSFAEFKVCGRLLLLLVRQCADVQQANYLYANYKYMGNLGQATSAIAEKFKNSQTAENQKALYTVLANKLTARGLASADIIKGTLQVPKFDQQNLPDASPNEAPIVLLWARYTGTNTAIAHNPDGDSCFQGQKQINDLLISLGFNVVTVGHGPRGSPPFIATFDVGEFYKKAPITSDRATQQSFFLALMEKYPGRVYQIGQKTGGMDGAALLGIPTIYLEPKSSAAIERMQKWSDGSLPFYRSIIIDEPAPAIVRVLKGFIPNTQPSYNTWKTSPNPLVRARARLAAMLLEYPTQMGMEKFRPKALPDIPIEIKTKGNEKVDLWRAKKTKEEKVDRFSSIVDWVTELPDTDVQEHNTDSALDGMWTKMVQSVSQRDLGSDTAGYSKKDLGKIEKEIQDLIKRYSTEKAAVLRTVGAYQTRSEAKLG